MTPSQFQALSRLLSLKTGPAQECARLVLVEGMAQAEAARQTGLSRQAAHQAVKRARAGVDLARQASSPNPA